MSFLKSLIFTFLVLCIHPAVFAQTTFGKIFWSQTNDYSNNAAGVPVHDGGYLLTGTKYPSGSVPGVLLLIRLNSVGDTIWTRTIAENDSDEIILDVKETRDHGFIMTGQKQTFSVVGDSKILVLKTDSQGMVQWQYTYGPTPVPYNVGYANKVIETYDSSFAVAGYNYNDNVGLGDFMYILKLDKNGKQKWQYSSPPGYYARGIVQLPYDSSFVMTGGTFDPDFQKANGVMLTKISKQGTLVWQKILTRMTKNSVHADIGENLALLPDSGFMIAGNTGTTYFNAPSKLFLMRTDKKGDTLWIRTYTKPYDSVVCNDMVRLASGAFVVLSYGIDSNKWRDTYTNTTSIHLLKLDPKGNTVFTKTYKWWWETFGTTLHVCKDNGFYITGNMDLGKLIAIKTDSLGDIPDCYSFLAPLANDTNLMCETEATPIEPLVIDTSLYTYQWYRNNVLIAGATHERYVPKKSGHYKVAVTDSRHCTDTAVSRYYTVIPADSVSAGNDDTVCYWISYYSPIGYPQGGIWSGPGITNGQIDMSVAKPGRHLYTYTVYSSSCPSSDSMWLFIDTTRPGPLKIQPHGSTSFCDGDSVVLSGSAKNHVFYYWNQGPKKDTMYIIKKSGVYFMIGVNQCNYKQDTSNKITVNVWPLPGQPSIAQSGKDSLKSSLTGTYYEWSMDGTILADTTQAIIALKSGTYRLRIKDGHCSSPYSDPYVFVKLGVENKTVSQTLLLYPNPVANKLILKSERQFTSGQSMKIYNMTGQMVLGPLSVPPGSNDAEINMHSLSPGMYYIRLYDGDTFANALFIKE